MRRGRPTKIPVSQRPNQILAIREREGLTQEDVAKRSGLTYRQIGKLERGEIKLKDYQLLLLAKGLITTPAEILGAGDRLVPIVGKVGAGAEVFPFDDFAKGRGLAKIACPSGLDSADTEAAIIEGDSMFPIEDGWILFFSRTHAAGPSDLIGKLCVVKIANDGPTLIKQLRRGFEPGLFTLVSSNSAPREDVELDWATRVLAIVERRATDIVHRP